MGTKTIIFCDDCESQISSKEHPEIHLSIAHIGEEELEHFDFCSMVCLGRWLLEEAEKIEGGSDVYLQNIAGAATKVLPQRRCGDRMSHDPHPEGKGWCPGRTYDMT